MFTKFLYDLRNLVWLALFLLSCINDAPRMNPLDPVFDVNRGGMLSGTIERIHKAEGIGGAALKLDPGNMVRFTDNAGQFVFEDPITAGTYTLTCEAEGFAPVSVVVDISEGSERVVDLRLNALPRFRSSSVTTHFIDNFVPPDEIFLELRATTSDADSDPLPSDLRSVWVVAPEIGFSDTLFPLSPILPDSQRFVSRMNFNLLALGNFEELIGRSFEFIVDDLSGDSTLSGPIFITRLMEEPPLPLSPTGETELPIAFSWNQSVMPFPFTYKIEIYPDVGVNIPPIASVEKVPSNQTGYIFGEPLSAGVYYWVLYIVDEFGNTSRSKQAGLIIN